MAIVETAAGTVDSSNLGRVLMHEHVFILSPEIQQNYPQDWGDEQTRVDDAIRRLNELKAAGIDTILDPTALGLGRYIPRVAGIAKQIDLNIIVATGLYTFEVLPFYFHYRSIDAMADMFVQDITEGIAGTGVKAGVIKCATDKPGVTPDVEHVLRACARAHRRTGTPITTHTDAATHRGLEQQKIFQDEGVDLSRVVIGHCGDSDDLEYLEAVLANGSFLGMDRFGIDSLLPTEQRVAVVAELCRRGYADRLVLSHDASCYLDWIPGEMNVAETMPNWHYLHISKDVLPALRAQGVSEDDIETMLAKNPRRYFENTGSY
jgi:phosphotriesterase-related protein